MIPLPAIIVGMWWGSLISISLYWYSIVDRNAGSEWPSAATIAKTMTTARVRNAARLSATSEQQFSTLPDEAIASE